MKLVNGSSVRKRLPRCQPPMKGILRNWRHRTGKRLVPGDDGSVLEVGHDVGGGTVL